MVGWGALAAASAAAGCAVVAGGGTVAGAAVAGAAIEAAATLPPRCCLLRRTVPLPGRSAGIRRLGRPASAAPTACQPACKTGSRSRLRGTRGRRRRTLRGRQERKRPSAGLGWLLQSTTPHSSLLL